MGLRLTPSAKQLAKAVMPKASFKKAPESIANDVPGVNAWGYGKGLLEQPAKVYLRR